MEGKWYTILWYTVIWKERSENKINSAVCYKHINEKGQMRKFFYVRSLKLIIILINFL